MLAIASASMVTAIQQATLNAQAAETAIDADREVPAGFRKRLIEAGLPPQMSSAMDGGQEKHPVRANDPTAAVSVMRCDEHAASVPPKLPHSNQHSSHKAAKKETGPSVEGAATTDAASSAGVPESVAQVLPAGEEQTAAKGLSESLELAIASGTNAANKSTDATQSFSQTGRVPGGPEVHTTASGAAESVVTVAELNTAAHDAEANIKGNLLENSGEPVLQSHAAVSTSGPTLSAHHVASKSETAQAVDRNTRAGADWSVLSYESPAGNKLEVGISGGSWGWLKVRAELGNTGEVHAYLRAGSSDAEHELRSQTADLQTYLGREDIRVYEIHVERARSTHWGGSATASDQQSGSQTSEDSNGRGSQSARDVASRAVFGDKINSMIAANSLRIAGAGNWLSVMA